MVYYANKMIHLGAKMNIQKLRAIFESSGSLRRLHMPQGIHSAGKLHRVGDDSP
jgi:hypothetical protein